MASIITATTTSGLTQSADNSGVLQLASGTGNLVTIPSVTGTAMVSGNMPAFSAYGTTLQTLTNGTNTKIILNNKIFDTANCFDSTTNYRFTPTVAGYYQITGNCSMVSGVATQLTIASIFKNGSAYSYGTSSPVYSTIQNFISVTNLVYMNGSTDYVELYVYHNLGSSWNTSPAQATVNFSGSLVRTA